MTINPDVNARLNLPCHIALVGLPGSGKSTVGRQLARRLGRAFLDTDQVIEKRIGLSIADFFEREGEEAFRDLEQAVVDELTTGASCVLSTGGGAVLRPVNRMHLVQRTYAIYLHSSPENVFRRLRHDHSRPLLQVADPMARLRELYSLRDPWYRESARFVIETGRPSVSTLLQGIVTQLETSGLVPGTAN